MWLEYCWGDDSKFLNYVSLYCFKNTFQRDCSLFLLEDKQKSKSEGVDVPWILPIFSHGIYVFLDTL